MQHPLAVAPPQSAARIVVVVGLVGKLVMVAMEGDPVDRSALTGQGPHHHEDSLKPPRHFKAAVCHQAMEAQGDPQHGGPIQNPEGNDALPAPKLWQQRNGGQHMHGHHEGGGAPFQLALLARQGVSGGHHRRAHAQLAFGGGGCRSGCDQGDLHGPNPSVAAANRSLRAVGWRNECRRELHDVANSTDFRRR